MRATANPELWEEVLTISSRPANEIEETPRLEMLREVFYSVPKKRIFNTYGVDLVPKNDPLVKIEFDKKRLKMLLKEKGINMRTLSKELGKRPEYVSNVLAHKRVSTTVVDFINGYLGEIIIHKVRRLKTTTGGGKLRSTPRIEVDNDRLKALVKAKGMTYSSISHSFGKNTGYLTHQITLGRLNAEHACKINRLVGEEVIKIVPEDTST